MMLIGYADWALENHTFDTEQSVQWVRSINVHSNIMQFRKLIFHQGGGQAKLNKLQKAMLSNKCEAFSLEEKREQIAKQTLSIELYDRG